MNSSDIATPEDLLTNRVIASLSRLLDSELTGVVYWCLKHEMDEVMLQAREFYCGGEVELQLRDAEPIYFSWDNNVGWSTHYSVSVTDERAFLPNANLIPWPASELDVWRHMIGSRIVEADVLGVDGVPYIVRIGSAEGRTVVGTGYETTFGHGDDVIVKPRLSSRDLREFTRLWQSERGHAA